MLLACLLLISSFLTSVRSVYINIYAYIHIDVCIPKVGRRRSWRIVKGSYSQLPEPGLGDCQVQWRSEPGTCQGSESFNC